MAEAAIASLMMVAWLSPGYPVGAYAYSHGLEAAVEAGDVTGEANLLAWLTEVCHRGSLRNDMVLLAHAHRAVAANRFADVAEINDLALALAPSRELYLETSQQGRSFLDATVGAWPSPALSEVHALLTGDIAYAVAVGAAAGAHGMVAGPVVASYGLAFVQNLVSAAIRSAPIGQAAGTRVVAALAPGLATLALYAESAELDEIGSACLRLDLGSFRHETQYSRIFRS